MKFFKVLCKCGHVGRNKYMPIWYPVYGKSKEEAALVARSLPRVKHNHKDAILKVEEITMEE